MELSIEQQIAFDKYIEGKNIFITGPGGTGKSALIKKINQHAVHFDKKIHVCALTGCAAVLLNCNAKTLHSWSQIGLGNGTIEKMIQKINNNRYAKATWRSTGILVIDEVSMLSLKLFNMLNEIGKYIRKNNKPFGGIQLIFSGDFYQLPPVGNKDEPDTMKFCFESPDWNTFFKMDCQIPLVKIFRQTDEIYSTILNQIRVGKIKRKSHDLLMTYVNRKPDSSLIVEPTKLFPLKSMVEHINSVKMNAIVAEEKVYEIKNVTDIKITPTEANQFTNYTEQAIEAELKYLTGNLMCEKEVRLKVGSQVMCIVNIKSETGNGLDICNGSQGLVTSFCPATGYPIVKYNNGIVKMMQRHVWQSEKIPSVGVTQIPLILAWALTIHKSQGASLDTAEIDVGNNVFACGQTYVALSRVKSLDGLYLKSFDVQRIQIDKKVRTYYEGLSAYYEENPIQEEKIIPLVIANSVPEFSLSALPLASEPIPIAQLIPETTNPFVVFQYQEAIVEKPEGV